jgi:hypothetical protein
VTENFELFALTTQNLASKKISIVEINPIEKKKFTVKNDQCPT